MYMYLHTGKYFSPKKRKETAHVEVDKEALTATRELGVADTISTGGYDVPADTTAIKMAPAARCIDSLQVLAGAKVSNVPSIDKETTKLYVERDVGAAHASSVPSVVASPMASVVASPMVVPPTEEEMAEASQPPQPDVSQLTRLLLDRLVEKQGGIVDDTFDTSDKTGNENKGSVVLRRSARNMVVTTDIGITAKIQPPSVLVDITNRVSLCAKHNYAA
jgi:hypothetical protein